MPKWTIFPVEGPARTIEADKVYVDFAGRLVVETASGTDHLPANFWAHFRQGQPPYKEGDPPGVGNKTLG